MCRSPFAYEYSREHGRIATQPMEEPENPRHLLQVIDQVGCDEMLMFATDDLHWDFDAPNQAFPITLPRDLEQYVIVVLDA